MEVGKAAGSTEQVGPLHELAQTDVPEGSGAAAAEGDAAQQAPEADEQVSDTDNDDEGKHDTDLIPSPCDDLLAQSLQWLSGLWGRPYPHRCYVWWVCCRKSSRVVKVMIAQCQSNMGTCEDLCTYGRLVA